MKKLLFFLNTGVFFMLYYWVSANTLDTLDGNSTLGNT